MDQAKAAACNQQHLLSEDIIYQEEVLLLSLIEEGGIGIVVNMHLMIVDHHPEEVE
jgi:hypothetical protein